jgi:hypothetical protein
MKRFLPSPAAMDVGAIGEMERMFQLHAVNTGCGAGGDLQSANGR